MEKTVFPLSRYWYCGGFRFYYAFGNTPPQDYLQNCVGEKKPAILVLGCGDIRSCFYSLWKHFDVNCPDKFDGVRFVLNDISAGVTARNILFLYLCLQMPTDEEDVKKWLCGVWSIWYCHELYPVHKRLLHDSLRALCKHSASWCSKENPLFPTVKFCSSTTLDEVRKVWKMWLEHDIGNLSVAQMHLSRQTEFLLHGRLYHSDDSVSKYVGASVEIPYHYQESKDAEAQISEVHSYVATGCAYAEIVLGIDMPAKKSEVCVNATLYERADGRYSLHYASIPYSCYFQAVQFTTENLLTMNPSSQTKLLVKDNNFKSVPFLANSIQQFSLWLQASHRVLRRGRKCVSFEFDCSDGLSFCLDAENNKRKCSFDLIYTSNLIDHMCPPNLILSVIPLLKDNGIAVTATLTKNIFSTFEEYLVSSFGFGCKLFPVILGIRCINYEGEEYTSSVTIQSRPFTVQNINFNPNEKLVLWEKVSTGAIPLVFPSGSELSPVICNALANCARVSVYPLLVRTKMPLMLNSLCAETAVRVLQAFMSNTCAEYTLSFWQPLSDKLCTTVKPYLHSLQTQFLLHGIHIHLTVTEESCPRCLHVPISSSIGLFHARISLLADFQTPNFIAMVHRNDSDSIEYLRSEALKGNDVHVFDCVTPSTDYIILDLYFYAPLHFSLDDYKVTLVISSVGQSENTLSSMSQAPTAPLSTWQVSYTSFIFSQAIPRLRAFNLDKFGAIASHISDGDKSEIVVDLLDRVIKASSGAKLQTEKVSSNELRISCGKISCCIEFLYPYDYDNVHIKLTRKDRKLSLVCPRACQQFQKEKPLFVVSPDKELSLFPNVFFNEMVESISGQQVTKQERMIIESCKSGFSEKTPLIKVKECLVCFFHHPEQDFFNFVLPVTGIHGLVLVNNRFFNYENRTPVIDVAFCFLEESFVRTVGAAWRYISSDTCNINVDSDEYECLKEVFHYFACRTEGNCKSTTNPSSNMNLLIESEIHKYFTRAVISLLLCDPEHYYAQVFQPAAKTLLKEENPFDCLGEECDACSSSAKVTKLCSRCRSARYCSKECQRAHWKVHKKVCKQMAEVQSQSKKDPLQPLKDMPAVQSQVEIPLSKPVKNVPVEMLPPKGRPEVQSQYELPPFQPHKEIPKALAQDEKLFPKKEMPEIVYEEPFQPFPLARYCYDGNSQSYSAYGNTPAEDYLQNCIGVKKPLVLLLGCGDTRSCFYTLWKNFDSSISTKRFSGVDFVLNDSSPAVLARNILFLYLVLLLPGREQERKVWLCALWSIWYCHELYPQHQKVLDESLLALLKYSESLRRWESPENPLCLLVNFSSPTTLAKISRVWRAWSERKGAVSVKQLRFSRSEKLQEHCQLDMAEYIGEMLCRAWTTVCGNTPEEIKQKVGSRPREVVAYLKTGNCFAESVLNIRLSGSTTVNPTLYERPDGVYTLDHESLPFSCYHHTVEFSPTKLISCGMEKRLCNTLLVQSAAFVERPLLANSVQQFGMWARTAGDVVSGRKYQVHFTYDNKQPLSFCQQLQHRSIKVGGYDKLFDLIYTSNLIDYMGLPGMLLSGMPLLTPCGSLVMTTLYYKRFADNLDDFLEQCFGFDCKVLPVLLGIRCVDNEGAGCSSAVMAKPVATQPLGFDTTQQCCRVLMWKKVVAQPLVIVKLPNIKSGNITDALLDSITKSAFSLLNKNCGYERNLTSNDCVETAILLLQSFVLSVTSPLLDSYEFWEPLSVGLRDRIKPFLSCFQTQLFLHNFHMHLTVTEDDCPLCKQISILGWYVGLFCAEVTLPLQELEPMFMAIVHRCESSDAEHLCSEARFGSDVHIFDCIDGTVRDQVLRLKFFVPMEFVEKNYKVTIFSRCPDANVVTTVLSTTSLKDLRVEFFGQYDFVQSLPFQRFSLESSSFGELTSHVFDGNEVQSEITLSASTLKALATRELFVTKIAANQVKLTCPPHHFILKFRYPIGSQFRYELVEAQKKVTIKGYRESHLFWDEEPIFVTNPDHQLSLPTQHLGDVMVLVHSSMQYTPQEVQIREECVNDCTLMPHLLNLKDSWITFFRDRNGVYFLLQSHDNTPLGLALINRCVFDYEHKVPALDMAFCFFDECEVKPIVKVWCSMTGESTNTVAFDPEKYKMLKDVVKYLSKSVIGDCKSAGRGSRYNTLCQHDVDIYFTRVVAYVLYCDPDLEGISAINDHLATCNNRTEMKHDLANFPVQTKRCNFCGRYSSESKECRCKKVQYCSTRCRTKHWPQHCRYCVVDGDATGTPAAASADGNGSAPAKGAPKSAMDGGEKCCYCGNASGKLKKCMRCWEAQYCSQDCQGKHWPTHKLECKKRPSRPHLSAKVEPLSATKDFSGMEESHSSRSAAKEEGKKKSRSAGKKAHLSDSAKSNSAAAKEESHLTGKKESRSAGEKRSHLSDSAGKEGSSTSGKEESRSAGSDVCDSAGKVGSSTAGKKESCSAGKKGSHSSDSAGKTTSHSAAKEEFCSAGKEGSSTAGKKKSRSARKKGSRSTDSAGKEGSSTSHSAAKEEFCATGKKGSSAKKSSSHSAKEQSSRKESHSAAAKEEESAKGKIAKAASDFGLKLVDFALMNRDGCSCCGNCTVNLVSCSSCELARYCSKECQKEHWKYHKNMCLAFGTGLH